MKIAMIVVRSLMGALLIFASATFLFKLFPIPPSTGDTKVYNDGLAVINTMYVVKVIELLCGICFITGRFTKLAAVVIFPILVNIVMFHGVVMPSGIGAGLFLLLGDLFLAWYYRKTYAPLFEMK